MTKVVINRCWGGFGLSEFALNMLEQRGYKVNRYEFGSYLDTKIDRHNEDLVEVVETLGDDANGRCARLVVVEIDGYLYRIDEYDGMESIETPDTQEWTVVH